MTKITSDDVMRVAALSHLGITAQEADLFAGELDAIVGFVEQLQAVDTSDLLPTDQVTGLTDVMRDDIVVPAAQTRDQLLANAPASKDGYIVVKRVLHG
jgi:aspartyl-tRNA(Asn)/glutamyl-tRNA(Gln) amidotransferase subunit C